MPRSSTLDELIYFCVGSTEILVRAPKNVHRDVENRKFLRSWTENSLLTTIPSAKCNHESDNQT